MRPAWSVLWLTTMLGCAQGLAVALALGVLGAMGSVTAAYRAAGPGLPAITALGVGALIASFFHLGRPERAWRAAAMWRTSWLSREVIALPIFLVVTALCWIALRFYGVWPPWLGAAVMASAAGVWLCTGMVYAGISLIREWATPLTVAQFTLMGLASGFVLAALLYAAVQQAILPVLAWAWWLTFLALLVRLGAMVRCARIRMAGTLQSAIGVQNGHIRQISRGFTAGSFNLREFSHGHSRNRVRMVQVGFIVFAFIVPLLLLERAADAQGPLLSLATAWVVQMGGLLLERWHFFAQVDHPQNWYYAAAH